MTLVYVLNLRTFRKTTPGRQPVGGAAQLADVQRGEEACGLRISSATLLRAVMASA